MSYSLFDRYLIMYDSYLIKETIIKDQYGERVIRNECNKVQDIQEVKDVEGLRYRIYLNGKIVDITNKTCEERPELVNEIKKYCNDNHRNYVVLFMPFIIALLVFIIRLCM